MSISASFFAGIAATVIAFAPGEAAACGEKTPGCAQAGAERGACPCDGEAAAVEGDECPHSGRPDPAQRAAIDPVTGQLTVPTPAEAAAAGPSARSAAPVRTVQQPHGGTMAAFPADRAKHIQATVDEEGKGHAGCGRGED